MSGIFELLGYIGNLRLAKIAGSDKATEGDRPTPRLRIYEQTQGSAYAMRMMMRLELRTAGTSACSYDATLDCKMLTCLLL